MDVHLDAGIVLGLLNEWLQNPRALSGSFIHLVVSTLVEVSSSSLFLIKASFRGETFSSPVSGQLVSASMSAANLRGHDGHASAMASLQGCLHDTTKIKDLVT